LPADLADLGLIDAIVIGIFVVVTSRIVPHSPGELQIRGAPENR
jgi:hypothetical protein